MTATMSSTMRPAARPQACSWRGRRLASGHAVRPIIVGTVLEQAYRQLKRQVRKPDTGSLLALQVQQAALSRAAARGAGRGGSQPNTICAVLSCLSWRRLGMPPAQAAASVRRRHYEHRSLGSSAAAASLPTRSRRSSSPRSSGTHVRAATLHDEAYHSHSRPGPLQPRPLPARGG